MSAWLLLVVLGLATYRVTRLVTKDDFPPVKRPRDWLAGGEPDDPNASRPHAPHWVGELITCYWCASGWVALGFVVGVDLLSEQSVPLPVVTWFAAWALGALTAHVEAELYVGLKSWLNTLIHPTPITYATASSSEVEWTASVASDLESHVEEGRGD